MIIEKNKNTFEDLLGLEIETEDKFLNKKLNSHICYFGGGGGGGQKQQDIAPTLRPFVTDVLERAKAEFTSEEPLAQYPGERVIGFKDEELAAQKGILDLVDRGISSDKRLSSADTYYDPALGLLKKSGRYTDKGASEITADEIQSRMNPYTQAVLDIAKRKAADEAALYDQQLSAQAAKTGGFGGSRQAILEARAKSDLGSRLSDIQVKGMEAAYNDAIRAAEAARGRQFQAASGLGALSGQFGNLGQQALGQAYREQGYRSGIGEAQRGIEQQRADIGYQNFVEARDYPARQLERYAGIAFGVPQGYLQQPGPPGASPFQQVVGGAATIGGLGRGLNFFNQGGNIGSGGLSTVYRSTAGTIGVPMRDATGQFLAGGPGTILGDTQKLKELEAQLLMEKDKDKAENLKNQIVSLEQSISNRRRERSIPAGDDATAASLLDPNLIKQIQQSGLEGLRKFKFDPEAEKERIKRDKGFAVAQMGAGILAADPSRGALAAIGQGIQPGLAELSKLQRELTDLPKKEAESLLQQAVVGSSIVSKLADYDPDSTYDITASGLSPSAMEKIVRERFSDNLTPTEMKNLTQKISEINALALDIAKNSKSAATNTPVFQNIQLQLLEDTFSRPNVEAPPVVSDMVNQNTQSNNNQQNSGGVSTSDEIIDDLMKSLRQDLQQIQ